MKKNNDGGYAFPVPMVPLDSQGGYTDVRWQGMTLRQYYAGQALAGLLMCADDSGEPLAIVARRCVVVADALITELERTNETQSPQVDPQADSRSEPEQA